MSTQRRPREPNAEWWTAARILDRLITHVQETVASIIERDDFLDLRVALLYYQDKAVDGHRRAVTAKVISTDPASMTDVQQEIAAVAKARRAVGAVLTGMAQIPHGMTFFDESPMHAFVLLRLHGANDWYWRAEIIKSLDKRFLGPWLAARPVLKHGWLLDSLELREDTGAEVGSSSE